MGEVQTMLQEAIRTLSDIPSARDIAEAKGKWGEAAKSFKGQQQVISAAKSGDITAINFLYDALRPQIASALWNNFLGRDSNQRRRRIEQGDPVILASIAYLILLSAYMKRLPEDQALIVVRTNLEKHKPGQPPSDEAIRQIYDDIVGTPSPLDTFDYKHFKPPTDIIQKLGFYLKNSLASEAIQFNKAEKRGGITGKISKGKDTSMLSSYEGYIETTPETSGYTPNEFEDIELWDAWNSAIKSPLFDTELGGEFPTVRTVFAVSLRGMTVAEMATKYNVTQQSIRNRLKVIAPILKRYELENESLVRLLKVYGATKLADMVEGKV
jgi:hypothetical protein